MVVWLIYSGILLYMETVFHLGCFGLEGCSPAFLMGLILLLSSIQTLVSGCLPEKGQKAAFWIMLVPEYLIFAAQAVYYKIFRQPLRLGAIIIGGEDALGSFWREALHGIVQTIPLLLLLALPLLAAFIIQKIKKPVPSPLQRMHKLLLSLGACTALAFCICYMSVGKMQNTDYSEEYLTYYDPASVLRNMGVLTMVQRDGWYEIENLLADSPLSKETVTAQNPEGENSSGHNEQSSTNDGEHETEIEASQSGETETAGTESSGTETPEPDTSPNAWDIDMEQLAALSQDNKEMKWLSDYIAALEPTKRNEYTGMFEGYNLIFLTAEAFSPYAIREDLTPTLYKMANSSFVFNNYYVPLWQTSTSDGEYVNCTGLIPDGQFSMRKSFSNNMAYTLPRFFAEEGVYSRAYHNNTLSYYDRHKSHPNLGYDFKASKLGKLSEEEWGSQLFSLEHPDAWPASDYEMMVSTIPEYISDERFHVYYMTVSGHANYNFSQNLMSSWNRDAVAHLDMSESARAYIACNIELDKALEYLLEQLELAGKLDNTVICISADHYPYALTDEEYEELAGKDLSNGMDMYCNSLILWNAAMEEPVIVDKACCSVDVLPTLLNLFGFDYDSRMYAGRDILSDEEGLVIFNDRSFVSDTVVYNRRNKTTLWQKELSEAEQEAYLDTKKQDVEDRYNFSAYTLRNDYYEYISRCIPGDAP